MKSSNDLENFKNLISLRLRIKNKENQPLVPPSLSQLQKSDVTSQTNSTQATSEPFTPIENLQQCLR